MSPAPAVPERIRWAVEQLELERGRNRGPGPAQAQVLEIGCGGGHAVALVAERLRRGTITGIDRSKKQVASARARNSEAIAAGRARIEHLTLDRAPELFGDATFHVVFAINVNAFWVEPEPSIARALRLLRKRGQLCLCYEPPSASRIVSLGQRLAASLEAQGVRVPDVRQQRFAHSGGLCVIGRRS